MKISQSTVRVLQQKLTKSKKLTKFESEVESVELCDQEIVSCTKLKSALNVVMSAIEHIGCNVGEIHTYTYNVS
jgi:hypothetical protein